MANTAAAGISGLPSARAAARCSCNAARTPGMPPRRTCSAMGCCSGGSEATSPSRWVRRARSFFGLGRDGTSGRGRRTGRSRLAPSRLRSPSPDPGEGPPRGRAGASPRPAGVWRRGGRSAPLGPEPPRPPRSLAVEVTSGSSRPEPTISTRSGSRRAPLGGNTVVTVMPSMSTSASARTTSPTPTPGGRSFPSRTPLGWRAPAARQVHVPSVRSLVSSTAMRGDTGQHAIASESGTLET